MERYYDIAGRIVKITGADEQMYKEERLLSNFRCENGEFEREISYTLVDNLSMPVGDCIYRDPAKRVFQENETVIRYIGAVEQDLRGAYLRIERKGKASHVEVLKKSVLDRITTKIVLSTVEAEHFIARDQGFILHASYIEYKGKAILFTAPSGTGKSTQADLWEKLRGAEIINGDRVAIKLEGNRFYAYGIPYAGSSGIAKCRKLPLDMVVCLSQAPKTTVTRMSERQAFPLLWKEVSVNSWDAEDVSMVSGTLIQLLAKMPIYHLACTPDETAIITLENELKNKWKVED